MRRPLHLPALLAALLAASLPPASAQDLNLGGFSGLDGGSAGAPAFGFLKLPVSARSIGLAARTLTTDEEASSVYGNPAALALVGDYFYSFSHAEILGEFRHENLTVAFPRPRWGGFGLGASMLSATAFEDARDIDEEPAEPSAGDIDLSLAYGRGFLDNRVAAGARLDLVRSSIDGTSAHGYAASFGLLFFLVQDWRVGAALQNLSHGVRYDGEGSPIEPLPLVLGLEAGKPMLGSRWSAHAGLSQGNEGVLKYYAGGEYRVWKHLLLRAGWDGSAQDRELGGLGGLALGTGVKYDRLTLDYGYKSLGLVGSYHAVTLNYSRKAVIRSADEVWLEKALARQRKGKYAAALKCARAAVAANPYNFKAQALAKQLQLELDRLDETAFSIYYTGGTDGSLSPQWRDGRSLGGLARRKTKLLELKGSGGKHLVLDAGDLAHAPAAGAAGADAAGDRYVQSAYALMPYDAVNVGAGELSLGPEAWSPQLPWLSSQQPVDRLRKGLLAEKSLVLKGGVEVKVMGALDPGGERAPRGAYALEEVASAVRRRAGERDTARGGKPARILVLLFQGSLLAARQAAILAPQLDVILLAGESQALGSPMRVGKTLICSPGLGGTHVGSLTLTLDGRGGGITSFRHFLLPLDASIPEDPGIKRLLAPITVDPNQFVVDDYDEDYRAQVVAYVHAPAPGSGGRIRLRDLRTGREFPLPPAARHNSRPILGYGKNRVAFLGEDSATGPREVYSLELATGRLDTLTRMGGRASEIRWILGNNALLAAYGASGKRDLWRIDPWSREARNLGEGRFGDVLGFDIDKSGGRLAVLGESGGRGTLWVTSLEMEAPLAVAGEDGARRILGSPKWDPSGKRLAFLAETAEGGGAGELRVFDFVEKTLLPVTLQSRVRDFAWSADGKSVYYTAGVNLLDINEYRLDSLALRKVMGGGEAPHGGTSEGAASAGAGAPGRAEDRLPRSEENPAPKVFDGRDGLLFEAASEDGNRRILWLDLETGRERAIADSAGCNTLR